VAEHATASPVAEFCAALSQLRRAAGAEPTALARRLGISRAQLYVILNGDIKRPPDWDRVVRPLVEACTGGDPRALDSWRRRHAVLVDVYEELRSRDRRAGRGRPGSAQARREPPAPGVPAARGLPSAAAPAAAALPAPVAGFTGRASELALLARFLDPAQAAGAVVVSAVGGLAGVGKTALAVQAGHAAWQRGWYPGGIAFIDMHGYDDQSIQPAQALDTLLRALGVPAERIPAEAEERAGLYRSVLAQIREPVLVIADNASSEAQLRLLLPGAGAHRMLITSRHTMAGLAARLVEVSALDLPESIALLDTALRDARSGDDRISADIAAAGRLAAACGGLPLALQITASTLKADTALSAGELSDELADEQDRLKRLAYDDGSGTATPSVLTAFGLSYRKLAGPPAWLFRLLPADPGPDISAAAAAALADLPVSAARGLLASLARAHLVEPTPAGRWRMHDLLRLYARQLSDQHAEADGREQARDRLLGYYLEMAAAADTHLRALPGVTLPPEFPGRDAALAWLDAERASLTGAVTLAAATGRDEIAQRLPPLIAFYLDWRRRFDDALATALASRDAARRAGSRDNEAMALRFVANALNGLRRFEEAIAVGQEAVAIFRETGDREGQAMALTNMGNALQGLTRFEEAIAAYRDAAALFLQAGSQQQRGLAVNNTGFALVELRRFEEASTAYEEAAAIFRQGGDRYRESVVLTNLGVILKETGRTEEAIAAYRSGAAIFRETGDQNREGIAMENLGAALRDAGRTQEAIAAYRDAAALFRETQDPHREGIALESLAAVQEEAAREEAALPEAAPGAAAPGGTP
jgi:tetratricopeptide (TPR) repeat protein